MIYNYARLRHQQTSDVSADFYLHILAKLDTLLTRYDPRIVPFYQYLAMHLNFEFQHFLRRRKLPRNRFDLLSVEELAERRIELQDKPAEDLEKVEKMLARLDIQQRIYAKLAIACPLSNADLRHVIKGRRVRTKQTGWNVLRGYRNFLRFVEEKRLKFVAERDRLLKILVRTEGEMVKNGARLAQKRENARRKFFSMDTRIPVRIVAEVTGDPMTTVQRHLKKGLASLKSVYIQWEKQNLVVTKKL